MMCVNWGIIYKKENIYIDLLHILFYKKAIKLILSIKVNDKSVKYTLHQI